MLGGDGVTLGCDPLRGPWLGSRSEPRSMVPALPAEGAALEPCEPVGGAVGAPGAFWASATDDEPTRTRTVTVADENRSIKELPARGPTAWTGGGRKLASG